MALGFESQLRGKAIEIKNELEGELFVKADKHRLEQVFTNLIDNGIKFNKNKGSIKIYCHDSKDKVKIFVEDSGIGIPAKDIPCAFLRGFTGLTKLARANSAGRASAYPSSNISSSCTAVA